MNFFEWLLTKRKTLATMSVAELRAQEMLLGSERDRMQARMRKLAREKQAIIERGAREKTPELRRTYAQQFDLLHTEQMMIARQLNIRSKEHLTVSRLRLLRETAERSGARAGVLGRGMISDGDLALIERLIENDRVTSEVYQERLDEILRIGHAADEEAAGVSPAGQVLWRAPRKGATAVIPTPVVHDNHVYVTSGYNIGCNLFRISKAGDRFSAQEVYKNRVVANHHGGVIFLDGHIYGHDDRRGWTCQNFLTGEAVWQNEDNLGKGSIVYADGHFVIREEKKKGSRVALIEASTAGYRQKGVFEQPDQSGKEAWPHPVIANGRLYLRDQDTLLCYDLKAR